MNAGLPDKRTALTAALMLHTELATREEVRRWADAVLLNADDSPLWLLNLCAAEDAKEAAGFLFDYAASPPFQPVDASEWVADVVASLFLRHLRGDFTFHEFLLEAAQQVERYSEEEAERLRALADGLERAGLSKDAQARQRAQVEQRFGGAVERVRTLHQRLARP